MRASGAETQARVTASSPSAPVPLPLADGCWRGPNPPSAEVRASLAELGWVAVRELADGSWAWRPLPDRRERAEERTAAAAAAREIASSLERAVRADAAPYPSEPRWLAVLNLTQDSFSDGGALLDASGATDLAALLRQAEAHATHGASALDLGAESTRPGAAEIPAAEQLRRLLPAIAALRPLGLPLSVDTRSARVAASCLDQGADWINDVSGLSHDPAMAPLAAQRGCRVVLMHMRGEPRSMREHARYRHLLGEIADELAERVRRALDAGMNREQIVLDPGIGFAKDAAQSRALVAHCGALRALGFPLLLGPSRKSFLAGLGAAGAPPAARDALSIGAAALCAAQGASWIRLHHGAGWDAVRAAAACARAARGEAR